MQESRRRCSSPACFPAPGPSGSPFRTGAAPRATSGWWRAAACWPSLSPPQRCSRRSSSCAEAPARTRSRRRSVAYSPITRCDWRAFSFRARSTTRRRRSGSSSRPPRRTRSTSPREMPPSPTRSCSAPPPSCSPRQAHPCDEGAPCCSRARCYSHWHRPGPPSASIGSFSRSFRSPASSGSRRS